MKKKLLTTLVSLAFAGGSLSAKNIAWVSLHPADNTPSTAAAAASFTNAPDIGYTKLLTAQGHNVTRFLSIENLDQFPDTISALNTNDLVIISRSVPSGHYQDLTEATAWNGITKPLMALGGYANRGSRLGFHTGDTIPDVNSTNVSLRINAPAHPIFTGIALTSSNTMVNTYARRQIFTNFTSGATSLQAGISVVTSALVAGGTSLAVVGTAGDAALNGMVIGEFPPGVNSQRGVPFAARRLVFLTGSRESGITGDAAGLFDLQADGITLFLNAVNYLTTPQIPRTTLPLVSATNLVAGDSITFSAGVIGDSPLTYQWYHNGQPIATGTAAGLALANLQPGTDAGTYQLIVTNLSGSATSTVASLSFLTFGPSSITNSLISYWPLDAVLGNKTVDLVSGYDMTMVNLDATNLVAGKWGNGFQFNGTNALLERVHNPTDALPISQFANFTISAWVNGPVQTDKRVFAEGSTTNTNPMLDFGTHNTGVDGTVDIYVRNNSGTTDGDHRHTTATAYDGTWHNIVYVQREIGNGLMKAQMFIDGVLDPVVITPVRPLTANTTAIGALRRASVSAWFNGMVDEVAVWNRALSADEVGILQMTAITNPPSRLQPLAINSFKTDLAAVVTGGSTTLRWDVSKDATVVSITPFGNVTGQTSVGLGSRVVTPTVSTNYVLTVQRGVDTLSATTSVAVVQGVAAGWTLLDNFDQSKLGALFDSGYWNDTSGNGGQVVSVNGNQAMRATSAGISFLNLRSLSIQETQAVSLFFRLIPGASTAVGVTNIVGLTDKSQRSYADEFSNIGSVLYATAFTNSAFGIETNGWYLGARNFPGGNIDYYGSQPEGQISLESNVVYNIWIDVTNMPLVDLANDMFTVYIQKEGGPARTVLFQDFTSDRDLFAVDPVLGGIAPVLDKLVVMGNSANISATFDDFYLSTGGYNGTVPKAYNYSVVVPPGPVSISGASGNQFQITWTGGVLQEATAITGPWGDVSGNPTSPYLVTPTGAGKFYRTRQ